MYMPFATTSAALSPLEVERIQARRPATREEIIERHLRDERIAVATVTEPAEPVRPASTRPLWGIRHNISRALINAATRIEPRAA